MSPSALFTDQQDQSVSKSSVYGNAVTASHSVIKLTMTHSLVPSVPQLALTYTSYVVLDVNPVSASGLSDVASPVSAGVAPPATTWYSQAV